MIMPGGKDLLGTLDALCPMHMVMDADGTVRHAGPTLQKLLPDGIWENAGILDLFKVSRPRLRGGAERLFAYGATKVALRLRAAPHTPLKGLAVPVPGGEGGIVNLSFGISATDAVRQFALNSQDFAATDLTIEMLFLAEANRAAAGIMQGMTERLKEARQKAEDQAMTDDLTGLQNRRAFDIALDARTAGGREFALMMIDLDHFKRVNDTCGHAVGDTVLKTVARILADEVRSGDLVARIGGDEFVVILDNVRKEEVVRQVATALITRISQPIHVDGQACSIAASIGAVLCDGNSNATKRDVLGRADLALYAAKAAGRSGLQIGDTPFEAVTPKQKRNRRSA